MDLVKCEKINHVRNEDLENGEIKGSPLSEGSISIVIRLTSLCKVVVVRCFSGRMPHTENK